MLEPHHHKNILKRLRTLRGQLNGIDKMFAENRLPADILNQFLAVESGLNKLIYQHFDEALRKALIIKINALTQHPNLPENQLETIENIRSQISVSSLKKLTRIIHHFEAVRQQIKP